MDVPGHDVRYVLEGVEYKSFLSIYQVCGWGCEHNRQQSREGEEGKLHRDCRWLDLVNESCLVKSQGTPEARSLVDDALYLYSDEPRSLTPCLEFLSPVHVSRVCSLRMPCFLQECNMLDNF
jgi:hypothetical protein